jgi:hypothetical protein
MPQPCIRRRADRFVDIIELADIRGLPIKRDLLCFAPNQLASNHSREKLSGESVVHPSCLTYGNRVDVLDAEGAGIDEPFKSPDGHLIKAALNFAKSLGPIVPDVRAPST